MYSQTADLHFHFYIIKSELSVTPEEFGPLAYVAGCVIQALYRKSKKSKNADSPRNQEMQALLWSVKVPTEENEYNVIWRYQTSARNYVLRTL